MKIRSLLLVLLSVTGISVKAQIFDTLPVIVHVIHNGEAIGTGRNISQAQVYSQFDVLNEDFRAQNADLVNVPAPFVPVIGDLGLNFAKALTDPNGNTLAEPGIHRVNRNTMGWSAPPYSYSYINNTIKPATIWDPTQYLNIWVTDLGNGTLVYSTLPDCNNLCKNPNSPPDSLRDGIVTHYRVFGRTGNLALPYNKGRAATHSLAQWLGLRRLAQYNSTGGCDDDCVADTPLDDYGLYGCPSFPQVTACSTSPDGAMFMNFLSYVDDSCMVMFTQGQKARVDSVLNCGYFQSALRLSQVPMTMKEHEASSLDLYPNPTQGIVNLRIPESEKGELVVYSLIGQEVYTVQVQGPQAVSLPQALPNGMYIVTLRAGSRHYTGRVFLAR